MTAQLTILVDQLRRDRRRDPYAGRREYSATARDVAAGCAALIADGQAAVAVPLLRKAVDRMTAALMYLDDSSGVVGTDLSDIMSLYARACVAAPPKPKTLAGWLVKLECDGPGWPEIRLREFAPALGEAGLAEMARLVAERAATTPAEPRSARFAIRDLREQLAEVSGDVDWHVAVLAEDLIGPHRYQRIAMVLAEADRRDEAVDWARRGLADQPGGWQAADLRDTLVELLIALGRPDEAVAERRTEFSRHPMFAAWQALRTTWTAAGTGSEPALRDWALPILRARVADQPGYVTELVDVLLDCGEPDAAWQTGIDHPEHVPAGQRLRLLQTRGRNHPEEVIAPYQQLIEAQILDRYDKRRYQRAVDLLRQLREVYLTGDDLTNFTSYLDELRARHRIRPTFLSTLDRTRW